MRGTFPSGPAPRLLWIALAALAIAGCSENQRGVFGETVENPSSQPSLLSPPRGGTGVSPLPVIKVGYEGAVDYGTASPEVIRLFDLGPSGTSRTAVAVLIAAASDGRGFEAMPAAQLAAPRSFEVEIRARTTGLRFQGGADIDDVTYRFTTATDPAFTVTTTALPRAEAGSSYGPVLLTTSGGAPPLTFAIGEGTLPGGLELDLQIGRISGAATLPNGAGTTTYRFTVLATDTIGRVGKKTFTIAVDPAPP